MSTVDRSRSFLDLTLRDKWYIDSGASAHICNDSSAFEELKKYEGHNVSVGNGQHAAVLGSGSLFCTSTVGTETNKIRLQDVLYVPSLVCNLI